MTSEFVKSFVQDLHTKASKNITGCAQYSYERLLKKLNLKMRNPDRAVLTRVQAAITRAGLKVTQRGNDKKHLSLNQLDHYGMIFFSLKKMQVKTPKHSIAKKVPSAKKASTQVKSKNAGAWVIQGKSSIVPYKHQAEALKALSSKYNETKSAVSGLLVLPTGGGKTLTAASWVAKNVLDRAIKVLWIAHRHELLEQAKRTFESKLAHKTFLPNQEQLSYRILSGLHDKPIHIKHSDDILFANKDSLQSETAIAKIAKVWLKGDKKTPVFLVIDEAHHATAETYRNVITNLRESTKKLHILGLTATPFRTCNTEQGLLKKVFPDDIIYKINLNTLIAQGILAEPLFETACTHENLDENLTAKEKKLIREKFGDYSVVSKETAKKIGEHKKRNHFIVQSYLNNRKRYKQTLVFAINTIHAICLTKIFKDHGIAAEFVLSNVVDATLGIKISPKDNAAKIERFRQGKIQVLINVNILTEGTDLPQVQTVFLARPTTSSILMTQMVGRALRGTKAGGTAKAYIVSFVDDNPGKIEWVNAEKLHNEMNVDFKDSDSATKRSLTRLISINAIEQCASLLNDALDPAQKELIQSIPFTQRVPIGIYHFNYLAEVKGDEAHEVNHDILIFDSNQASYARFLEALPEFYRLHPQGDQFESLGTNLHLQDEVVEEILEQFFHETQGFSKPSSESIRHLLLHFHVRGETPLLVRLEDRRKFNLQEIAQELLSVSPLEGKKIIDELWECEKVPWKALFGIANKKSFVEEIDLAKNRLLHPEEYLGAESTVTHNSEFVDLNSLSLQDIKEHDPAYAKELSDAVYAKHQLPDGTYESASKKFRSRSKIAFQIDHIIPMAKGGLTELSNLQLLSKKENGQKGAQ